MDALFNKKEVLGCTVNRIDTVDLKDVLDSVEKQISIIVESEGA